MMAQGRPKDAALIALLAGREGLLTIAGLTGGTTLRFRSIAWGYDPGDEYAHVTANPGAAGEGLGPRMFYTHELTGLWDGETERPLFRFPI